MVLRNFLEEMTISYTRLSRSLVCYSEQFYYRHFSHIGSPTTPCLATGFRLFRFRSPLLTESLLISFPHPTEMFQFGWCPICYYLPPCGGSLQHITPCGVDCSIRKPSDRGSMAPPRRVSPPYASFLGMNTQGIHCQLCSVVENKGSNSYVGFVRSSTKFIAVLGNLRQLTDGFPLMMQLQIYIYSSKRNFTRTV